MSLSYSSSHQSAHVPNKIEATHHPIAQSRFKDHRPERRDGHALVQLPAERQRPQPRPEGRPHRVLPQAARCGLPGPHEQPLHGHDLRQGGLHDAQVKQSRAPEAVRLGAAARPWWVWRIRHP